MEKLFEYMLDHDLLEGDRIKHFNLYHRVSEEDVERVLVPWIRAEGDNLRVRSNWSTCLRDNNRPFKSNHEVLCYHKTFDYQHYECRLVLDDFCVYEYSCCSMDRADCIDCRYDSDDEMEDEYFVHYDLIMKKKPVPLGHIITPRNNRRYLTEDEIDQSERKIPDDFLSIPTNPELDEEEAEIIV